MSNQYPFLGNALHALIDALGVELIAVQAITRAPAALSARASFKLSFADGRILKGRRVGSAKRCAVLVALAPALNGFPLTRIVSHQDNALLEEWAPGIPFAQYAANTNTMPGHLQAAGALLGRLSRVRDWPATAVQQPASLERLLRKVAQRLAGLVRQAMLLPEAAEHLYTLAYRNRPQKLEAGLIHHDFCADNLVITPDGNIFVVDNEDMRIGILDADLARSWCRWPMTEDQRQLFCAGYRRYRNIDGFLHHATFWSIWALSGSAWFRIQRQLPCANLIDCLQRLAGGDRHALWPGVELANPR